MTLGLNLFKLLEFYFNFLKLPRNCTFEPVRHLMEHSLDK